ncbi:hypothetical protein [Pseudomonas sp. NPDC090208]|uniref:hypothetical protein n=1 Tax=Pseudomonas sp. NPDC090208 TaxID=3364478 RepID=UPI0037FA03A6
MTNASIYNGMRVVAELAVPEFIESHRKERKWAHRVMWNRDQRFTITQHRVFMNVGGCLFAHPKTVALLNEQLAAREAVK